MPERWRRSAQWPGGPVAGGGRTGSPKVRGKVCSHTKGGEGPQGPPLGSAAAACSGECVWGAGFDSLSPEEMLSRGRPHGRPRQAVGTGTRRGTVLHGPGQARYEQVKARAPKASGGFPEGKAAGPRGWRPWGPGEQRASGWTWTERSRLPGPALLGILVHREPPWGSPRTARDLSVRVWDCPAEHLALQAGLIPGPQGYRPGERVPSLGRPEVEFLLHLPPGAFLGS